MYCGAILVVESLCLESKSGSPVFKSKSFKEKSDSSPLLIRIRVQVKSSPALN